jgi:hypothetical protein
MNIRIAIALALGALAFWLNQKPEVQPAPKPNVPVAIDLSGSFDGPDAAVDCAIVAAMASEIADVIEWDGMQSEPLLTTGVALDQMRTRTREFLCKGVSLGEKYPLLRQKVASYLDEQVGNDGGELTPAARDKWVKAYRDIARSASAVVE